MIWRDKWGFPVKGNWLKKLWTVNICMTVGARHDHHCYNCGAPASEPSQHWPLAMVCENCRPFDSDYAAEYAYHCEIGQ